MKGSVLFVSGLLVGVLLMQLGFAQNGTVRGLNHIGISVSNYDEAFAFYTKKMGFREAYTVKNPDGSPRLTYLQLSRETFVELIPAAAGQPTGVTHFGIEVGDIDAKVAQLRRDGVELNDVSLTPAKARYTRMHDLDGVEIEVMEFGPDALQRKAMDAWK